MPHRGLTGRQSHRQEVADLRFTSQRREKNSFDSPARHFSAKKRAKSRIHPTNHSAGDLTGCVMRCTCSSGHRGKIQHQPIKSQCGTSVGVGPDTTVTLDWKFFAAKLLAILEGPKLTFTTTEMFFLKARKKKLLNGKEKKKNTTQSLKVCSGMS